MVCREGEQGGRSLGKPRQGVPPRWALPSRPLSGRVSRPLKKGHERDAETGNDYMHFRFFSASMGRFQKPDSNFDSPLANPQGWNLYSYVKGNPVNFNDPTGHEAKPPDNNKKVAERKTKPRGIPSAPSAQGGSDAHVGDPASAEAEMDAKDKAGQAAPAQAIVSSGNSVPSPCFNTLKPGDTVPSGAHAVGEVTINTLVPQADEHQAVPEGQAGQAVQEVAGAVAAKGAKPINAEATKLRKVIDKTISTKGAILEALAPVPS